MVEVGMRMWLLLLVPVIVGIAMHWTAGNVLKSGTKIVPESKQNMYKELCKVKCFKYCNTITSRRESKFCYRLLLLLGSASSTASWPVARLMLESSSSRSERRASGTAAILPLGSICKRVGTHVKLNLQ